MARRPYVPSGKSDPGALPILAAAAIGSGVVAGLALGFVSQWLSLLLIFPAALGAIVGGVGAKVAKSRNVRQPIAVALIALAAGLCAEASLHLMKYRNMRSALADLIEKDPTSGPYLREFGVGAAVDSVLAGETGKQPLLGYLDLAAAAGVTITKAGGSSSSKPTLTGIGVYVLWAVNLLIVCGIALAMIVWQARRPFCEGCVGWYDVDQTYGYGAGDNDTLKQTVLRLEGNQYAEALRNLGQTDGKSASVLKLVCCSKCNAHDPVLELTRITGIKNNKLSYKVVFAGLISPNEASQLREAAKPAA